jgi:Ca2+-binding EF-hand superfamily protein
LGRHHYHIFGRRIVKRISAWLFVGSLLAAISAAPLGAKEKSLELVFRIADSNSDGKLSSSEVAGMRTGDKENDPKRHFRKLDLNGDGRVTLEEFKRENERSRDRP